MRKKMLLVKAHKKGLPPLTQPAAEGGGSSPPTNASDAEPLFFFDLLVLRAILSLQKRLRKNLEKRDAMELFFLFAEEEGEEASVMLFC